MLLSLVLFFITIYIFIKLYSVFGNSKYDNNIRKENEHDNKTKTAIEALINSSSNNENTQTIVKPVQIVDPKLSYDILKVKEIIPDFVPEVFLKNAEKTFDTIFDAFINGKHQVLKSLLDEDLYNSFANQIKRREDQNLRQEINIIHQQTSLSDIIVSYKSIQLVVVMDVKQMAAMVDINGQSLDNPNRLYRNVQHKWTFETSILGKDNEVNSTYIPNWIITRTSSIEK
ncbi:MAG: Tim44/TimA family putative adaptor protein [Alphaproteobacteria bacterium]|nr:Tim44/TimA family putative adaptor protein [Alphaproteobacteria bacterium]